MPCAVPSLALVVLTFIELPPLHSWQSTHHPALQGLRIDYVLCTPGLLGRVVSCEILSSEVLPPKWSDHAGGELGGGAKSGARRAGVILRRRRDCRGVKLCRFLWRPRAPMLRFCLLHPLACRTLRSVCMALPPLRRCHLLSKPCMQLLSSA